jgi:hypothetical protein
LQRVKERRAYSAFSKKYSQIGFKPGPLQLLKVLFLTVPKKSDFFNFLTHKAILREWRANRFPEDLTFKEKVLPPIEILIVAAGKDIELLPHVIRGAITKTINPVNRITVIIPGIDQIQCESVILRTEYDGRIEILLEDDVIGEPTRIKIRARFKNRYGWVLQQLLALEYILKNKSLGVLLMDADTILIKEVAWLDRYNHQKLMVGNQYHRPFHQLLNKLIKTDLVPKTTHVTHHMLIQPEYLREIFQVFSLIDVDNLLELLVEHANPNEESALSVDFELYGQALLKLHPNKVELRKFSNISTSRLKVKDFDSLQTDFAGFNSVSMHSYLEEE